MKALPFILFLVYLQDAICDNSEYHPSKLFISPQKLPKKSLQILISRKLMNPKKAIQTKKPAPQNKGYTAFPAVGSAEKKLYHVPDSPYFPLDPIEQKTRVKKVLPDYVIGAVRRKRAAGDKVQEKDTKKKGRTGATASNKTRSARSKKSKPRSRNLTSGKLRSRNKAKGAAALRYTKRVKRTKKNKKRSQLRSQDEKQTTKRVEASRRLIAAKDAIIEDYPYVVSIQKNGEHWCAGALLNQRLVITTANCIWKSSRVSRLRVRTGSRHTNHGGEVAKIQEVIKHPYWSIRKNPDHDVALILLDRQLRFSHGVHGVDLPNRVMLPAFEDAWVTSWGAERRDGVYDKKDLSLQVYHSRLIDRAKCNNVTQRFGVTVTENFICLSQTGRRAPCTRDTGAPAVSDGVLWGLASWGIRKLCGTERFPAMFSYLASQENMDFIINATHYLMADERFYPYGDRFPTVRIRATLITRPDLPF